MKAIYNFFSVLCNVATCCVTVIDLFLYLVLLFYSVDVGIMFGGVHVFVGGCIVFLSSKQKSRF